MKKNQRRITFILILMLSIILLGFLVFSKSPDFNFSISFFNIPSVSVFFALLFFTVFGLIGTVTNNFLQAVLVGIFLDLYLVLRFFHITHWFFAFLLILLFGALEYIFVSKS